jgi:branched-subunit amino acid ABC-type transport system permease component
MWWGGFAIGPRYLLPMLPFLVLPLILVFREWGERIWMRLLGIGTAVWSLVATWGLTLAEQAFPPDTIHNPLIEYAWPNWRRGNIARNLGMLLHLPSLWSLLPLLVAVAVLLVVLWSLAKRDLASIAKGKGG